MNMFCVLEQRINLEVKLIEFEFSQFLIPILNQYQLI